ncbi:hypothetical protein QYF61_024661 [Mycteria americana]|uniref:Uncharacterized protein n=1 Tax=Mycteria americana TaxID=33587 RepID=A0AAN7SBC2_MYCAM|nr:hypothetical protein QYF61_024661 [Mycteria americana]
MGGWGLNHFPGQPVPMLENPFSEVKFPNIQSKPPLAQLEAISSCPITCYLGEETDPHLSTTSFQVVVESDEVSPQPPLLQAKQSQLPQLLLIRLVLQTLHQLRCPSLDTLQHLNSSTSVEKDSLGCKMVRAEPDSAEVTVTKVKAACVYKEEITRRSLCWLSDRISGLRRAFSA